ncbi:MAG: DUF58 domain-containing protein [Planctomycetota bacterium]
MSGGARQGRAAGPPCARAQEPADFLARLERLHETLARRLSQGDGNRSADGRGRGSDFAGFRPYRSGEDVRQLDFALLARLGKPFVRILRPGCARIVVDPARWECVDGGRASGQVAIGGGAWAGGGALAAAARGGGGGAVLGGGLGVPAPGAPIGLGGVAGAALADGSRGGGGAEFAAFGVRLNGRHVLAIGDLFRESLDPWLQAARQAAQVTLVRILSEVERDPPQGAVAWHASESEGGAAADRGARGAPVYLERLAPKSAWRGAAPAWGRIATAQRGSAV